MKKFGVILVAFMVAFTLAFAVGTTETWAADKKKDEKAKSGPKKKYEKYVFDKRHEEWSKKKWATSDKKIKWRMSDTWGGLVNHDAVVHFCDSVKAVSGGRMVITPMTTGSVVGAFELFDAVSKGVLDAGHSWSPYWKGKDEAFVLFGSVPLSMDAETYGVWYWLGEGRQLMDELYGKFNLKPFFLGNSGQELGLFSKVPRTKLEDFKGIKLRTAGWYMDILNRMGVGATSLPGAEIYLALERGIIDAAEFSSPAITYGMGFHEICKYVIEPGFHQPSAQMDLFINMKKWNELPDDLKAIVEICAHETDAWFYQYMEEASSKSIRLFKEAGVKFIKVDDETLNEFRRVADTYIQELKDKYPSVKKIRESQENFIKYHAEWKEIRSGVAVWPSEKYLQERNTKYQNHYQ